MTTQIKNDRYDYKFNGVLYLVRDLNISSHYIGSGETLALAIKDAEDSIKKFKPREKSLIDTTKEGKN